LIATVVKHLSIISADGESFLETAQGVPLVRELGIYCRAFYFVNLGARLMTCFGFISPKKTTKEKKPGKGGNRFWKNVGLRFKTPREAIEGIYFNPLACALAHRVL
jgi:hypothetical protein